MAKKLRRGTWRYAPKVECGVNEDLVACINRHARGDSVVLNSVDETRVLSEFWSGVIGRKLASIRELFERLKGKMRKVVILVTCCKWNNHLQVPQST